MVRYQRYSDPERNGAMVHSKILRPRKEWCNDAILKLKPRREWLAEAAKKLSSFARAARRLPSIHTRRSGRRSGRSHREIALFYKPHTTRVRACGVFLSVRLGFAILHIFHYLVTITFEWSSAHDRHL